MQKGQGKIGRESALERVILIWGIPSELHSNRGTYFADLIVKEICKIWWMMQHFHCDYNSQFSGLMERTNRTIKTHLAKITCAYSFPWRRKWQPTPAFLPGESQGRGSLVGCCLWGCTELDTTEAT